MSETFDFILDNMTFFTVTILAVIWLISQFKQQRAQATNTTIKLLQDEVSALKERLETITKQVDEASKVIEELKAEKLFLKDLVTEALTGYFNTHPDALRDVYVKVKGGEKK